MKTLVTILALQMLVGASALAEVKDSIADVGVEASVASVQQGGNFNEDREEVKSRVDKFLESLEEGGVGGGRSRAASTPRPTGNDWKGPANR